MKSCSVPGCDRKHSSLGYCRMHYERWRRTGGTDLIRAGGPCSQEGCDERVFARGYCRRHYKTLMRYGTPEADSRVELRKKATAKATGRVDARFWGYVQKTEGCWLWTGSMWAKTGYGRFWCENRTWLAHRWAYARVIGPIPDGRQLDHLCKNQRCVRPDHLEPVTAKENNARSKSPSAANAKKTQCPRGHPLSGANLYVDPRGRRGCRPCQKEANHRSRAKKKASRSLQ